MQYTGGGSRSVLVLIVAQLYVVVDLAVFISGLTNATLAVK